MKLTNEQRNQLKSAANQINQASATIQIISDEVAQTNVNSKLWLALNNLDVAAKHLKDEIRGIDELGI